VSGKRDEHAKRDLRARGHQRRRERIALFIEEQRIQRDWINFHELADRCAHRDNPFVPDEAVRSAAYDRLRDDLLVGDFEEAGESQILFLTPAISVPMTTPRVSLQARRMTRRRLRAAIETPATQMDPSGIIRSHYLAHCWLPRRMAERWLEKHGLQSLLPFFAPRKGEPVLLKKRDEAAATRALAAHLKQNEHITRHDAEAWLSHRGFKLAKPGFRHRVWPNARQQANLLPMARAGRKPKSVR
jgi:hypothetical protein